PGAVSTRHPVLSRAIATALLMSGDLTRLAAFLSAAEPLLAAASEQKALGGLLSIHAIQHGIQAQMSGRREDLASVLTSAERVLQQPDQPALHVLEARG